MKSTHYLDLLRGRTQDLPAVRSKVVRVFLSSTFTGTFSFESFDTFIDGFIRLNKRFVSDTLVERDSLIENVFPQLKDYCRQKYGLEFQVDFGFLIENLRTIDIKTLKIIPVRRHAMGNSN